MARVNSGTVLSGMATAVNDIFPETNMEQHLDAHTLDRYTLGFVNDKDELARIETHLRACSTCKRSLENESDFVKAIKPIATS
jgi:hypothetical protein